MVWLVVDNDNSEWIFDSKPCRNKFHKIWEEDYNKD